MDEQNGHISFFFSSSFVHIPDDLIVTDIVSHAVNIYFLTQETSTSTAPKM